MNFYWTKKTFPHSDILHKMRFKLDEQIEYFVVGYNDNEQIVVWWRFSRQSHKMCCDWWVLRGSGVALQLITELADLAYTLKRPHLLFIQNPNMQRCSNLVVLYHLWCQSYVVLLENSATRLQNNVIMGRKCVWMVIELARFVMNENPFTLGHRYLIEQALQQCDHLHLFIVGEDALTFSLHWTIWNDSTRYFRFIQYHSSFWLWLYYFS